jgi:hypothetical protein
MPDDNARKRLKKKMLDRWENEGGRVAGDSPISTESNPPSDADGESSRTPASRNRSTRGALRTPTKNGKLNQK